MSLLILYPLVHNTICLSGNSKAIKCPGGDTRMKQGLGAAKTGSLVCSMTVNSSSLPPDDKLINEALEEHATKHELLYQLCFCGTLLPIEKVQRCKKNINNQTTLIKGSNGILFGLQNSFLFILCNLQGFVGGR